MNWLIKTVAKIVLLVAFVASAGYLAGVLIPESGCMISGGFRTGPADGINIMIQIQKQVASPAPPRELGA